MKALFWSAVISGVAAMPIPIGLMIVVAKPGIMGEFVALASLKFFGWLAAVVMGVAAIAMAVLPSSSDPAVVQASAPKKGACSAEPSRLPRFEGDRTKTTRKPSGSQIYSIRSASESLHGCDIESP